MKNFFGTATRKGNVRGTLPIREDSRIPQFNLYGIDCSGSMSETTRVVNEAGETLEISKIDQANRGLTMSVSSMLRFQQENTRFQIRWQVVPLDTYCKAIFPTFVTLIDHTLNESQFKAEGSTNIEALFNTFATFITRKHLGHYNRALNIILMSDGIPTDVNGWPLSEERYKSIVDRFKGYLDENGFSRNVELYFIAVGDAAEPFGRYFAGDEHFFKVEESESIAEKLDYVTRQSLVESSTIPTNPLGFDDQDDNPIEEEEDDDSFDCGDADPLDDDPEKEESKDDADEEDDFIDDSEDDESNEDEDNEDDEEDEDDISLDDIIGF